MTPTERERIEKEAKKFAEPWTPPDSNRRVAIDSYIAGATAEHDKARNQEVSPRVAGLILQVRDALALKNYDEAYHALYQIASPNFDKTDPWKELESLKTKPT